jgi:TIR domain
VAAGVSGFWSYTHHDDTADRGALVRLARHVIAEFGVLTGESLELFLDRDSLEWGAAWRERIDEALAGATFFIPIVTPRYFQSQECRKELLKFRAEASRLGLDQLLLPVYWVTVRELDDEPTDEAMALVAARQREDLRDVRLLDETSSEYRTAVHRLAARLAEITEQLTVTVPAEPAGPPLAEATNGGATDDSPGLLEVLAAGEAAAPRLADALDAISEQINIVGDLMERAAEDMRRSDARGAGFAGRLRVSERVARELQEPSQKIADLGHVYASELVTLDPAMLTLLDAARDAAPEDAASATEFIASIQSLWRNAETALGALSELVAAADEAASVSRTVRQPLRQMRAGLQGVLDGQSILEEWKKRADDIKPPGPPPGDGPLPA